MIIGRSLTALNSSRTVRAVRRRETTCCAESTRAADLIVAAHLRSDDNSRRKVQKVRGDSSAIYLLSGNTTPAESRSALKPLTEAKTCRMSNWTRILTFGLDVRKSKPAPPWSAKSLRSQDATVIQPKSEFPVRQHKIIGIRADAHTAHQRNDRPAVEMIEADVADWSDERHLALPRAGDVEMGTRTAGGTRLVVHEVVIRAERREIRIARLGERRMDRDEQNAGKQEGDSSFHGSSLFEMPRRGASATPTD
jgi:hypothetical protein